jgi:polyhydroxyalkanoate synthesis regulator phasin
MDDRQKLLPATTDPTDKPQNGSEDQGRTAASVLRYAAFGILYRSVKRAQRRAGRVSNRVDHLSRMAVAPLKPLANSSMFKPIREQVDILADRGQQELDRLIGDGQIGEERSRQVSQEVLNSVIGEVIGDISSNPQIQVLIQSQVEIMAAESPSSPQLDDLVRKLADNYINYLNEHPEQVQNLIAGQSLSLTAQIREEVNERMVTGDSLLEMLARRLFRRPPREELPSPPPEVKALVAQTSIESNYPILKAGQHESD